MNSYLALVGIFRTVHTSIHNSIDKWCKHIGHRWSHNYLPAIHYNDGHLEGGFSLLELNFDDRTCACNSLSLYGFTSGNNFAKLLHDTYVFSETVDASALKLNCLRVSMWTQCSIYWIVYRNMLFCYSCCLSVFHTQRLEFVSSSPTSPFDLPLKMKIKIK